MSYRDAIIGYMSYAMENDDYKNTNESVMSDMKKDSVYQMYYKYTGDAGEKDFVIIPNGVNEEDLQLFIAGKSNERDRTYTFVDDNGQRKITNADLADKDPIRIDSEGKNLTYVPHGRREDFEHIFTTQRVCQKIDGAEYDVVAFDEEYPPLDELQNFLETKIIDDKASREVKKFAISFNHTTNRGHNIMTVALIGEEKVAVQIQGGNIINVISKEQAAVEKIQWAEKILDKTLKSIERDVHISDSVVVAKELQFGKNREKDSQIESIDTVKKKSKGTHVDFVNELPRNIDAQEELSSVNVKIGNIDHEVVLYDEPLTENELKTMLGAMSTKIMPSLVDHQHRLVAVDKEQQGSFVAEYEKDGELHIAVVTQGELMLSFPKEKLNDPEWCQNNSWCNDLNKYMNSDIIMSVQYNKDLANSRLDESYFNKILSKNEPVQQEERDFIYAAQRAIQDIKKNYLQVKEEYNKGLEIYDEIHAYANILKGTDEEQLSDIEKAIKAMMCDEQKLRALDGLKDMKDIKSIKDLLKATFNDNAYKPLTSDPYRALSEYFFEEFKKVGRKIQVIKPLQVHADDKDTNAKKGQGLAGMLLKPKEGKGKIGGGFALPMNFGKGNPLEKK